MNSPFQETDTLAADLAALLHEAGLSKEQEELVMQRLVSYIVRREHSVFNYAHQLGAGSGK